MTLTTIERAAKAARKEINKLRKTQVPEYPGLWKTHDGLGWENLDDVVAATTRAVLLEVRAPSEAMSQAVRTTEGWEDMIDFVLNEPQP